MLTEGAAAQYGTDAIAGVINIILKKNPEGGSVSMSQGAHYAGDGDTTSYSGNIGFEATSGSYINLAAEYREHEHTNRGDVDPRVVDPARIDPDAGGTFPNTNMPFASGYPYLNQIFGDAAYEIKLRLGQCRRADRRQRRVLQHAHLRRQTRGFVRELPLAEPRSYTDPDTARSRTSVPTASVRAKKPKRPTLAARSASRARRARGTGMFVSTYGKDEIDMFTRDSANASLFANTGQTPVNFYDGTYTLDAMDHEPRRRTARSKSGLAAPMNLAFGARVSRGNLGSDAR